MNMMLKGAPPAARKEDRKLSMRAVREAQNAIDTTLANFKGRLDGLTVDEAFERDSVRPNRAPEIEVDCCPSRQLSATNDMEILMRTRKICGGWESFFDLANRHLCWAFAATGAALFTATIRLVRSGLLTREQSLHLMRGSMHLHGLAIRILRRRR